MYVYITIKCSLELKENRELFITKDGSKTLYWPKYDEHYHSIHGALTESQHVFIKHGLEEVAELKKEISLLEVGFGTGLNTFLSYLKAKEFDLSIHYTSLEPSPISLQEVNELALHKHLSLSKESVLKFHELSWGEKHIIEQNHFQLTKEKMTIQEFDSQSNFDIIYFDAFAPSSQPELWTPLIFKKLFRLLNKTGVLTTYCAKGQVKRDLKSVGFTIESLPGPPGKREMTRARK